MANGQSGDKEEDPEGGDNVAGRGQEQANVPKNCRLPEDLKQPSNDLLEIAEALAPWKGARRAI